jgi:hypothetical protein
MYVSQVTEGAKPVSSVNGSESSGTIDDDSDVAADDGSLTAGAIVELRATMGVRGCTCTVSRLYSCEESFWSKIDDKNDTNVSFKYI